MPRLLHYACDEAERIAARSIITTWLVLVAGFFMRGRMVDMKLIRFNMRVLLLVVALMAALLGYAQYRRYAMLREAKALEAQGFKVGWRDSWFNSIWPQAASEAVFSYDEVAPNKYHIGSKVYSADEAAESFGPNCDRLRALGVECMRLAPGGNPTQGFMSTSHGPH